MTVKGKRQMFGLGAFAIVGNIILRVFDIHGGWFFWLELLPIIAMIWMMLVLARENNR